MWQINCLHFYKFVIIIFFQGTTFPALNSLLAQWAPPLERSKLGSLVFGGAQFGTIVGNALSGVVLHATEDWRSVFYLFGGLGTLWFIIWVRKIN